MSYRHANASEWLNHVLVNAPTYIGDFAKEMLDLLDQEEFIERYHDLCNDIDGLTDGKFDADYSKAIDFFEKQMDELEDAKKRVKQLEADLETSNECIRETDEYIAKMEADLETWEQCAINGDVEFDL